MLVWLQNNRELTSNYDHGNKEATLIFNINTIGRKNLLLFSAPYLFKLTHRTKREDAHKHKIKKEKPKKKNNK